MKVAFFTEGGSTINHFDRSNNNARTDIAWKIALNAVDFNLMSQPSDEYDLGIFIIPKKCEDGNFDLSIWADHFHGRIRPKLNKVAFLQEGPHQFYQDYRIETQISYFHFLDACDIIFCHNEFDKKYYEGLIPHKKVSVFPSLMIEDAIPAEAKKVEHTRNGTMIGGNWCSWYSGQDSYFIAQELGEDIYSPSMGRKQEDEKYLFGIEYLPYMNWSQWMVELSKKKYAVHLMRTWAAGTFPLNCARLKVPCIGWGSNDEKNIHGTDTQRLLFPELTVPLGDMISARKIAAHLKENELFYEHCAEYAFKTYNEIYSEKIFIQKFEENINGI